ncbi:hypothetical protein EVAR_79573_1 [Eumeta japonica]|uniref:Uncharacterized protein n=1 Tax=Eumeta variegata TaxID=151549 RepID=A0A4C1UFJ3_EUMVA|nr:hypothetical protein EVAR_79573_1 [Eumeta japonica]
MPVTYGRMDGWTVGHDKTIKRVPLNVDPNSSSGTKADRPLFLLDGQVFEAVFDDVARSHSTDRYTVEHPTLIRITRHTLIV